MAEPLNPKKIPSALPWYRDEWERSTVGHLKDVNAKLTACRFIEETGELELQVGDDVYRFGHVEDCCESVWLADDDGLAGHVGKTLLTVEEVTEKGETEWGTHTYTFYHFKFPDAVAVVRWCGESNGYYSESVGLVKAVAAEEASEDVTGSATIVAPGEQPPAGHTPISAGCTPAALGLAKRFGRVDDALAEMLGQQAHDEQRTHALNSGHPGLVMSPRLQADLIESFDTARSKADLMPDIGPALPAKEGVEFPAPRVPGLLKDGGLVELNDNARRLQETADRMLAEEACCDLLSGEPAGPFTLEEMVAAIDELENQIATYEPPSVRRVVVLKGAPIDVVPLGDTLYMSEGAFQHLKKEGLKAFAPSVGDLTGIPVVDGTKGEDP